jgi:mannonate dehydratase
MVNSDEQPMRVGSGHLYHPDEERLRFLAQLGVEDVLLAPHWNQDNPTGNVVESEVWSVERLRALRERIEEYGLRVFGIERLPVSVPELLVTDGSERREMVETVTETIRNAGDAGVSVIGYSAHPPEGGASTDPAELRGGATARAFDLDDFDRDLGDFGEYSRGDMWDSYERFLERVLPVAEEAGVTLAVHPADPPLDAVSGAPVIFRRPEDLERAMSIVPSDNHGLKFCLGCFSEMGADVEREIRRFGDDITYVHFRDVVGSVPSFHETFVDDPAGNFDEYDVVDALDEVGFDGVLTPDHVPDVVGEDEWPVGGFRGRAFTVGYLRGLLKSHRRQ